LTTGLGVRDRVSVGRRMTQSLVRAYQTDRRLVPGLGQGSPRLLRPRTTAV